MSDTTAMILGGLALASLFGMLLDQGVDWNPLHRKSLWGKNRK